MAKEIKQPSGTSFQEAYEGIVHIFDTVGGNVSETEDDNVLNAILDSRGTLENKIKLLVVYARDLERGIHYSRRN